MVDTVFVGRYIGGNGIGGLVVVFPIQRIMYAIAMMIALGSSTAIGRSSGEKDYDNVKKIIKNAFTIAFFIVIPLALILFIFRDNVLRALGAGDKILPYAHDYLSIILFGSIFQVLTVVIGYMMMSLGNRKILLRSNITGSLTNVIVDYLLVAKFSYGVKGAAIATILSQFIAFIYAYYHFI